VASFELEYLEDGDPDVAFVTLGGQLDLTNAVDLVQQLEAVAAGRPLIVDLGRVLFLDSAALQRFFRLARERGPDGLAIVIEPDAPVAATLEIVEFRRAATVASSRREAETALARSHRR